MKPSDVNTDDVDRESIELALTEARKIHENQVEISNRLNDEALNVIKIDILLAGLLFTVIRLTPGEVPTLFVGFSGLLLVGAMFFAYFGYSMRKEGYGLHPDEFLTTAIAEDSKFEGISLVASYTKWVNSNEGALSRRKRYIFVAFVLIFAGVGSISAIILFA